MRSFLFICAFVIGGVAASSVDLTDQENDYKKYENITMGESGIKCTRQGRKCLFDASCVNYECYCPMKKKGEATIECVEPQENLCYLSGDPHVNSYVNARVDVNIPCRYRASRFVTRHVSAVAGLGECGVEVYVTNQLRGGRYIIRSVHISVGVVDHASQVNDRFEIYKSYDVKDVNIYKFYANVSSHHNVWGTAVRESVAGVDLYPTFEEKDNFAVVQSSECEFRVKFRPPHPGQKFQDQLYGVTIMAPLNSTFIPDYGNYPYSLCGTPNDSSTLYHDRAKELGFHSVSKAIIYDIALQRPDQRDNPKAAQCYRLFDKINGSSNAVELLNEGGFILDSGPVSRCLENNNIDPIEVFNAFLSYKSSDAKDTSACGALQSAATLCARAWKGAKTYNC